MEDRPKEKKGDDRLRILRQALGVSQKQVAEMIGISLETVRSIEAGRRKLTNEVLGEVEVAIGAKWNPEAELWEFGFKPNDVKELIPFTRELYTEYRRVIETPPGNKESWRGHVLWEVERLLDNVSDDRWYPLLFRIERCLRNWRREFNIEGTLLRTPDGYEVSLGEYLDQSRPAFLVVFNPKTGKIEQFMLVPAESSEIHKLGFPAGVLDPVKLSKKKSAKRGG